ncbi:hypothetical protein [Actimicrobium antarcticum]
MNQRVMVSATATVLMVLSMTSLPAVAKKNTYVDITKIAQND